MRQRREILEPLPVEMTRVDDEQTQYDKPRRGHV